MSIDELTATFDDGIAGRSPLHVCQMKEARRVTVLLRATTWDRMAGLGDRHCLLS